MILSGQHAALGVTAAIVVVLGVVTGRPDIGVLAAPALVTLIWSVARRSRTAPAVTVAWDVDHAEPGVIKATALCSEAPGIELIRLQVWAVGYRPVTALLAAGAERSVGMSLTTARTGLHRVFALDHLAEDTDGLHLWPPERTEPLAIMVHPRLQPLGTLPLPPRLAGLTGNHVSTRIGDGFEIHDVHEFTPGDRLRRIDWRASARRSFDPTTRRLSTLYTRRTHASADATVMLVVDSRDDLSGDVATWSGGSPPAMDSPTSMDLARAAASSMARAYLDGGDRVGLADLGTSRAPIAPAAGRRQWQRISYRLVRLAPRGAPARRLRPPQLPSGSLVVVFSTFLDEEASSAALQWRGLGHRVVAVDVLPSLDASDLAGHAVLAFRMVQLERRLRVRRLIRSGVEVVPTGESMSADLTGAAAQGRGVRAPSAVAAR